MQPRTRNISMKLKFTHFCGVLGMPAHHLILPESFGCPWLVPKHQNCEISSENRNSIEMSHLLVVLGMPDQHPTLPVWFECSQTALKGSRAAGNKNYDKWSRNRI